MHNRAVTAIIILLLLSITVSGQKQINSPYARFNIGILESSASYKSLGMGGVGIGLTSNNAIFFANPASYSTIDTNSFVFDIGIDYGILDVSNDESTFRSDDMNFDHLIMGFPISKGFGVALGIVPVSGGYYQLLESVLKTDPGYNPDIGEYSSVHYGDGGLNNLFLGTGLRITKNFSAGINMNVLFGKVDRYYQVTFSDYYTVYHDNEAEKLEMHGINFNAGLIYTAALGADYFFNAGATFSTGKSYRTSYENLTYRYTAFSTRDTIEYTADDSTRTRIPGSMGLGVSFGKKNKFTLGADYIMTRWSEANIPGPGNYAADTKTFRFGLEYIPDRLSNRSLLKRIEYRIGAHTGDNYLILNNKQVKEYGASLGFGIPMRKSLSRTNVFFDFTRRSGSGSGTPHLENYYSMGISLNLYDGFWFLQRKYD